MPKYLIVGLLLLLTGCVNFTDKSGTRHYVVIGFGVVSISRTNEPVQVIKSSVLGAEFQTLPLRCLAGFESRVELNVETNVNAIVEVQSNPFKPLYIEVQK